MKLYYIKKKEDFSKVFRSKNYLSCDSFTINYSTKNRLVDKNSPRYGIVTSKKIGNAVQRNFAKRRVKALKNIFLNSGKAELDYVVIVKKKLINEKFKKLSSQLEEALNRIKK